MSDEACGSCRFWQTDGKPEGLCRRGPPAPVLIPGNGMMGPTVLAIHPPRQAPDWCGEYRPKQEPATVTLLHSAP